jgi:hypothetical protein
LLKKNRIPGSIFKTTVLRVKKMLKLFPVHTMQAIGAPDVGEWLTSHPNHITPRKTQCPLYRRLGGPHNQFGHIGKAKNLLPLPGFES